LTNIRKHCGAKGKAHKKHRAKMGRWSFKRLENAIKYNAELNGIYLEYVDSHYTSQTCSRCNVVLKKNRKGQSLYSCSCGLKLNADLNAARNIAYKWCTANGNTSGQSVNLPIVTNSSLCSVQLQAP
jgi:transposase